jgi:hypothetical protein
MDAFRSNGEGGRVRDSLEALRYRAPQTNGIHVALLVAAAAVLGIGIILQPSVAGAGVAGSDGPGGTVSVGASGSGTQPGWPGASGGGGGAGTGVNANPWICTDTPLALNDESQAPGGALPGGWFSVTCVDLATGSMETTTEWITQAAGKQADPAVDPRLLAVQAERSLRLPDPQLRFSPEGSAVVNLPTWLWVAASIWRPESVNASAGGVTATAVAMPISVSWTMGDGTTVTCNGPGVPYVPTEAPDVQTTTCEHTYLESSVNQPSPDGDPNDGSFTVTATVNWSVSWSAVGAPGGGALPSLTTASTLPERVEQVESVNTLGGGGGPGESL